MKKFLIVLACVAMCLGLTSCGNMQLLDTTYSFERVIITLPDRKVVEGKLDSWKDFEDGDQLQVKIDGKTYLVHSSNVVLISE